MYLQHFQFREKPFSLTPDTEFFYAHPGHQAALNTLLVALKNSEGFIKVVGEVGTGKTLLGRMLLKHLDRQKFVAAYIPNPHLAPDELKLSLAKEIGVSGVSQIPAYQLTARINQRLIDLNKKGKQVVLVLDEAQTMPRETIESLRLLTNLETEKRKLLHVVMLGQPELDTLLSRQDLRQLKQRIVFSETIKPLKFFALRPYIAFRLQSCGAHQADMFSFFALLSVYLASGGIPRLINILCHKALIAAYSRGDDKVTWHAMRQAIADTQESHWRGKCSAAVLRFPLWMAYALAGLGGFVITLLGSN
jgi:MSHA biogenesis protein MshM